MAAESLDEKIDRYQEHFLAQIDLVSQLDWEKSRGIHHRILYCALLDAMSKPVFPTSDNRSRYLGFLQRFADWSDGGRISLIHLDGLLKRHPSPAFEELRLWVRNRLVRWRKEMAWGVPISADPERRELAHLWPRGNEHEKPLGIGLDQLSHFALLWRYRNSLLHEYRAAGDGIDSRDVNSPYYQEVTTILSFEPREESRHWELIYPAGFLDGLCRTTLTNLVAYLRTNALNPFDYIVFGPYWLAELN